MFDIISTELGNIVTIIITAMGGVTLTGVVTWIIKNLRLFRKELNLTKKQVGDAIVKSLPKNIKLDVSTKIEEVIRPEFVKLETKLNKAIKEELGVVKDTQDGIKLLLTILKEFKVTKDNEQLYLEVIGYLERNELTIEV